MTDEHWIAYQELLTLDDKGGEGRKEGCLKTEEGNEKEIIPVPYSKQEGGGGRCKISENLE